MLRDLHARHVVVSTLFSISSVRRIILVLTISTCLLFICISFLSYSHFLTLIGLTKKCSHVFSFSYSIGSRIVNCSTTTKIYFLHYFFDTIPSVILSLLLTFYKHSLRIISIPLLFHCNFSEQ